MCYLHDTLGFKNSTMKTSDLSEILGSEAACPVICYGLGTGVFSLPFLGS